MSQGNKKSAFDPKRLRFYKNLLEIFTKFCYKVAQLRKSSIFDVWRILIFIDRIILAYQGIFMSRHFAYRFTLLHSAVLAATLGVSNLAHAISLGQPAVQSEQHEPLSATISVTGIDAQSFSVSLANGAIYQQMGLSQTNGLQARFMATSDTSGVILLSSSQPISMPFTDVVLNLSNGNEHFVEAQTLLMPLPKNNQVPTRTNFAVAAQEASVDLPTTSNVPASEILVVQTTEAPPFFEESPAPASSENDNLRIDESAAPLSAQTQNEELNLWADEKDNAPVVAQQTQQTNDDNLYQQKRVISSITPEGTDTQIHILTEQITRRVLSPAEAQAMESNANLSAQDQKNDVEAQTDVLAAAEQTNETARKPDAEATYVVQRGDSLWSIAHHIAQANNLSVSSVMQSLHTQNPDAFYNNNINRLKTGVALNLPSYSVIPSQKAIQDAIAAQRQASAKAGARTAASTQARSDVSRPSGNRNQTVSRPLPRPQVTLVTPSQSGNATGSQNRPAAGASVSSGGVDTKLVENLKSARNKTAQSVRQVNALSQEVQSATQRLQLQNQRLAELEARLKALKENNR